MDGAKQESDRIRRMERKFETTRLGSQWLAAAYSSVLPVIRSAATRPSARCGAERDAADGRVLRRTMGA